MDTGEACASQIKPVDKGLDEAHRILRADVGVEAFGEEQGLRAIMAGDVRHAMILTHLAVAPESVAGEFLHGLLKFS